MPTGFGLGEIFNNPLPLSVQWNRDRRVRDEKTLPYLVKTSRSGEEAETKKGLISEYKQKNNSDNIIMGCNMGKTVYQ